MVRYFVAATIIVVTVVAIVTAWGSRDRIRSSFSQSTSPPERYSASPTPHGGFEAPQSEGRAPVRGDAPWALSALPDCLIQESESSGQLAYVRSKLPQNARIVPSGSILHYGPCTISVGDGEAVVSRGSDVLRIPPRVILYRADQKLALLRITGGNGDLRIYTKP